MSPRPRVDHLRKPQIVAAAAEVLYERGLFDTRIGDIAERAGNELADDPLLLRVQGPAARGGRRVRRPRVLRAGCPTARISIERASDKLVHLIEETSLGPGGLNDYTLWMEIWVRARRDPTVRQLLLPARPPAACADRGHRPRGPGGGRVHAPTRIPDEFALVLSGLLDGLGVQVTLGQPDVTPARMVDRCLTLASGELGCDLVAPATALTSVRASRTRSGEEVSRHAST